MNIEALEANAETIERQITRLEAELDEKRLELQLTRNDIAAARLQAWYRDNPGIELAVGDQLAVTDEFREERRLYGGLAEYRERGVRVESVYLNHDDEPTVAINPNNPFTGCSISLATARRMRQAWLAQEANR